MNKQAVTEKMKVHEQWYKEAKTMTLEQLPEFLNKLSNDYPHDYGTICHALSASAIAAISAVNKSSQGGITGFQASAVMWEFIKHWIYNNNKCGLRIIDYDIFLYPQYENDFQKTINKTTWELIQKEAENKLKEANSRYFTPHPDVIQHWKNIIAGIVPFGYQVVED